MICIDKSYLGTKNHLQQVTRGGPTAWVKQLPVEALVLGGPGDLIRTASRVLAVDLVELVPAAHRAAYVALCGEVPSNVPWHMVISEKDYRSRLVACLAAVWDVHEGLLSSDYGETLKIILTFLERISRAAIDEKKLRSYLGEEVNPTTRSTLQSFLPESSGLASQAVYDIASTTTGRAVIKSGPRILTLPVGCKDILKSRDPGGSILQVDYVSLEPRVALRCGKNEADIPVDVYDTIASTVLGGKVSRSQAKIATLAVLYGMSSTKLSNLLGLSHSASLIINKIRDFFGFHNLGKELKDQFDTSGHVTNLFGRPLQFEEYSEYLVYNHFVQSSATDIALVGFASLWEKLRVIDPRIKILFVIHDALILDVPHEARQEVECMLKGDIELPSIGNFPVQMTIINDSWRYI